MIPSLRALACGLALSALPCAVPSAVLAQEADPSFSVGTIVVTARGMAGSGGPMLTSVDRMGGDRAQGADVGNAYELVGRMPGVQVTEFDQGTTSGKVSFRAFNGEGTINAVKLLIDGVPSNSNNGNMPWIDLVFPLAIETIEVVRGTADPRHGLHAIAGSLAITTRGGGTYADARASRGSFDTTELQAAAGLQHGAFGQDYAVAWRKAGGYREHGRSERLSLSGKWSLELGRDAKVTAIARHYDGEAQEPGYLTFADSRRDRRMTNAYNASDGGTRRMNQFAATIDAAFSDRLDWTATAWANRLRDDRYVKFSAQAAQQRRLEEEDHHGLSTALHWHGRIGAVPLMLEAGGNLDWQDNRSLRWLAADRMLARQTRDQQFDLTVGGAYVQAVAEPAPWLRITPAWRFDRVGGTFANRLDGTTAPANDYGTISQPKLSLAVLPGAGVTLYGNWGRTFQIGLGAGAYLVPPRLADLAPSVNEGWELGASYRQGRHVEARVAWWRQTATGEIARRLNDPAGDFENVGATRRSGIDLQVRAQVLPGLEGWGALAWQKATIAVPPPTTPAYAGNAIDHVPEWLWSGGIEWQALRTTSLGLSGRGQSAYHLTSANAEGRWGRSAVFDLTLRHRLAPQLHPGLELGLTLHNLLADLHEYVWWDGAQTLHSPGEGRALTASLRARM